MRELERALIFRPRLVSAAEAASRSARVEWKYWQPRRRTALDWIALATEEHGREIVEVYPRAMRGGDWRAAEALMSRIYGKPEAAVVAHVPPNPALPVLKSMSLDEKLELLGRLRAAEFVAPAQLPIVEVAPPAG